MTLLGFSKTKRLTPMITADPETAVSLINDDKIGVRRKRCCARTPRSAVARPGGLPKLLLPVRGTRRPRHAIGSIQFGIAATGRLPRHIVRSVAFRNRPSRICPTRRTVLAVPVGAFENPACHRDENLAARTGFALCQASCHLGEVR